MIRRASRSPGSSIFLLSAGAGLMLAAVGVSGCGSDSKAVTTSPDADTKADAGAPQDRGVYGACTTEPPADPAPVLTGRWAIQTIASRYVPATGLTSAFYTRTVSVLLADQTQTGTDVSMSARYCAQAAEDPESLAHVIIPEGNVASLKPFVRNGTYTMSSAGAEVLLFPSFVEVIGATLANPESDPLPTDASDPNVIDQDQDGNPGITIKLSGLASGDLYVVQRQTSTWTGIAVSADRVEGHYGFISEQNILASVPATLKALASQVAIGDPNLCASTFVMVRVGATTTCADVLADATNLFD
jgi:hypothetical protein